MTQVGTSWLRHGLRLRKSALAQQSRRSASVPHASFHPVFQGRPHPLRPDARFRPRPSGADLSGLRRPPRHFRRSSFRDLCPHKSTFLPPFTPRPLWRFHATMDALTPAGPALLRAPPRMNTVLRTQQVSLLHVPGLPDHSVSNHPRRPTAALTRHPSARRVPSRLRHLLVLTCIS